MIEQIKRVLAHLGSFLQPAGHDTETARVFPDTNLALHWKRLDEIDWLAITGASRVRIEIAPVFLRELEQQKVTNRSKKLRDRASRVIQWLATFMDQSEPTEIRPKIRLAFVGHEPRIDLASHRLNDRVADDILIASALDAAGKSQSRVGIATGDLGLRAKLRSHSRLQAYVPPESDRLPDEGDPDQKELNELRAKIARMEAARPVLRVSHADDVPFAEIRLRSALVPVESLAAIKERFPLKATHSGQGMAFAGAPIIRPNDSYNLRVQRFWREWADYEQAYVAYSELLQRSFLGEFVLWNDGGKPATDIDIYVNLPSGVVAMSESELPKIPRRPKEPTEKVSLFQSISDLDHPHFPVFNPPRDGDAIIEDGRRIRFSAERLKHDFQLSLEKVVLAFEAGRAPFSFEADFKASCAEAAAASGKLRFVVKS